jgi:hypothetical protein
VGVRNYLIEGVSGTGKTTAAGELQRRGYHVVHGDRELSYRGDPATGGSLSEPAHKSVRDRIEWEHKHWIWDVDKIKSLIADQRHASTFFSGGSRNSHHFIDLFDEVFILEIDLNTLNRRLTVRPEDEFGGRPTERELIVRLHASREDVPKRGVKIDGTAPVERVVDEILKRCRQVAAGNSGQPEI